jgi:hypothetical protein
MINYRLTPWDTKSLNLKTLEITEIQFNTIDEFTEEYSNFENNIIKDGVQFVYTRINAQNFELRRVIQNLGFYFAESSMEVSLSKLEKFQERKLPKIDFHLPNLDEIEQIRSIAYESFDFSRFHEDFSINGISARERYSNWILDLAENNLDFLVSKIGNQVIGFNIQKTNFESKSATLILAGCKRGAELFVMPLWNQILLHNKNIGISKVTTLISSANIGVANVYFQFGFKVNKTLFGFHKHL